MTTIQRLEKLYDYPILIFYLYYYGKSEKTFKEWREELTAYEDVELEHPLRQFIEMVDKYAL